MRFVLAFVLVAHAIAHLVGFISSWKLAALAELSYKSQMGTAWTGDPRDVALRNALSAALPVS